MTPRSESSTWALRRALPRKPNVWRDLAIALVGAGVCTAIRLLLSPELNSHDVFTTYFPAVMLAGLVAGTRAMLFALAASGLIVWWAFIPPPDSFVLKTRADVVALCTFFAASGLVGAIAVYLRRTLISLWAAQDAQQRLAAELARRAADAQAGEARFRAVADNMPGLVFEADAEGRNTFANTPFLTYCGLDQTALRAVGFDVVHPEERDRVRAAWTEAVRTGHPYQTECRLRRADSAWRWFLVRGSAIRDAEGRVEKWAGVCTDITEQREAAELLRTLLQEVSHRVKNSLTLVSGLLKLQARSLEGEAHDALEEASRRVNAVARVHDQLWRRVGANEIDLEPFLMDLCAAIAEAGPSHVTVCRVEPALVSPECAVPLGLLVNELLTNAYKHAYPEGEAGEVRIRGVREPNRRYRVEISDQGVGLPPGFDLAKPSESLGMKVITSLAVQLQGELTAGSAEPGARFTLAFPLDPDSEPPP